MSFNRSLLTQITKDLNKKPSKPKVSKNQWQHPGEITNIPSNNITMDGVSYPVLGVPNVGQPQMMYPNQQYSYPGASSVMEYPFMDEYAEMAKGGQHGGLDRWFAEKWVDVKSGKPCGRQEGESRAGYPACRPSKRVSSDTPKTASELSPAEREKFKRSKTSSERINYQHRRKQYGGDTMDYNYDYPTELMAKGGNVPTNPALWSRAKSAAKAKYDVYPSAYANGFAAKWYKSHGGGWRKGQYGMEVMGQGGTNNPGFQALPDYVQHKILSEMSFGGYMPEFGSGGYTVTRSSDRKGKTHKVTGPDGTVKYFGDSKLGQHPKDPERKAAFYARHKKNLDANPYFRAFARATWQTGGESNIDPDASFLDSAKKALSFASDILSIPARAVVKGLTGKYQDPSEALGVKNPIGAFAINAIADPVNLISAGTAGILAKTLKKTGKAAKVLDVADRVANATTLQKQVPVSKIPVPGNISHYGASSNDVINALTERGTILDQRGAFKKPLHQDDIEYFGTYGGRPIVGVNTVNGPEYFYKSTSWGGKKEINPGDWQAFGQWMDVPTADNWFVKGKGFENLYGSQSFKNIANQMDDVIIQKYGVPKQDLNKFLNFQNVQGQVNTFTPSRGYKEGGQTRNEREMVEGIADILSQVRDPQNRAEIAKQMMSDFRRDDVAYNQQKFLEMSELKYGGMQKYQTAGQVIKPKKGYIDLSEYGYNALDAEGIAKAEELNKMYPGSKFVCTAKGCADIARQIGDAKGYDFGRNNAWGYRGNIPELYVNPGYKEELEAGKPLHDPRSYGFPEEVKQLSGVLVGLNRKDNFDGKMAKTTAEANDSRDYANRMLYAGNNAGHEHIGYFGDGMMYHGTASSKDHPAFYVIDDPKDGIALPGISKYNVVNAMGEPGLMDRAASTFNSVTGSVADAFNDFKAKFIKQQGGTAYNEMVQRLAYKKKGGLLKAQVGKQNPFFPNLNPAQEAADAQAQMPSDTNPFGVYDAVSQEGAGIAGQMKSKILKENTAATATTTDQKKQQKSNPMLNPFFALNTFIGGANLNAQAKREEANRQMLRSQNATWNQQYDSIMNRGDYSQGPSSYGLYKPDQMSVPGFFADGGLTSLDVALGMAPTMVPNLTPDLNYAAFDMPATKSPEVATPASPESYNVAPAADVAGLELDPDKMLEAIAGTESGSKKGQSKVGMRTKLIGDGGKRASASGTFQITDGTLKQIYKKDQFNDAFPTFNAFKAAFDKDPQVEYQAARSLAVDHIKNYGVYALGAWYYPEFASRAAKGDMTVMNQIPRADYGNRMTWGQNFNKNLNSYKKALSKSQFGGEMELTMEEIQQIKAMGGKVEFC